MHGISIYGYGGKLVGFCISHDVYYLLHQLIPVSVGVLTLALTKFVSAATLASGEGKISPGIFRTRYR